MDETLGYYSYPASPDTLMREGTQTDRTKYWEYVLLCVDNVPIISDNVEEVPRKRIGKHCDLKEDFIGHPKLYLGEMLHLWGKLPSGSNAWDFSLVRTWMNCNPILLKPTWKMDREKQILGDHSYHFC